MEKFTRKTVRSYQPEGTLPEVRLFDLWTEKGYWEYVRYYLQGIFAWPWYGYVVAGFAIGLCALMMEWYVILISLVLVVVIFSGTAMYAAHMFMEMEESEICIGIREDGVSYVVEKVDEDSEETYLEAAVTCPWYELDSALFFDRFVMLQFVATSKMRVVIIPTTSLEDGDRYKEEILGFWKENGKDVPRGMRDNRMLLILLVVGWIALKFILRHF